MQEGLILARRMKWALLTSCVFTLSGCYVNQAWYDPNSFTPKTSNAYYFPPKTTVKIDRMEPSCYPEENAVLTLAEVIDISLKNNPSTTISWATARVQAAAYAGTQAAYFPNFSMVTTYFRQKEGSLDREETDTGGETNNRLVADVDMATTVSPDLALSYTILDFGQRKWSTFFGLYSLYFADWSHNRVIQQVVQSVSNAYYQYILQKTILDGRWLDIEVATMSLAAAEVKGGKGKEPTTDVLQARTSLIQARVSHEAQKAAVEDALADLLNTMGLPSNIDLSVEFPTTIPSTSITLKTAQEFIDEALTLRPDLKAAETNVLASDASYQFAKSQFFPTVSYSLLYGQTYLRRWLHDGPTWTSLFTLNIPLFSGLSQVNAVKQAKANKESAKASLRQQELTITQSIRMAYSAVNVAAKTLEYTIDFLKSANEQYRSALMKYKLNQATILDVVSAQTSLTNSREQQAQAIQQWYASLINLTYAVGYYSVDPAELEKK